VLAGGTDLYPATPRPALDGPVLDITGIGALHGIARGAGGLRIGATTSWAEIARADLPPALQSLRAAAREVGAIQIQMAGTVGGNLCTASPAADGVPPLLALDARVELASVRGTRILPLADFIVGPRRTARAPDELVTAVLVPAAALAGRSVFLKLGARRHLVISIAMVAARIAVEGSRIAAAAVAVGACSPVAVRLPSVEAALTGAAVTALPPLPDGLVADGLSPIDDVRADAAYRRRAAAELVRRAVAEALATRAAAA
jgi:CO/xanthine dehydrogenase FAD-binding subunit